MSYHHLSALECMAGLCRVRTQMCVPHCAPVTHLDLQQMLHCPQLRDSWFTPVCDIPSTCSNPFSPVLAYSGMTIAELCACKCIGYKDLFLFINILKKNYQTRFSESVPGKINLSLSMNNCVFSLQKLKPEKPATGWELLDFPSMLSCLKVWSQRLAKQLTLNLSGIVHINNIFQNLTLLMEALPNSVTSSCKPVEK